MITLRKIPRSRGRPYLERLGFGEQSVEQADRDRKTGAWRVRLHHFVGPDDAGHHNHPFKWSFSIVISALWGASYTEEVLELTPGPQCSTASMRVETRRVRFFNWIPNGKYHRIVQLHGDVWTVFVTGPRVSSWGFWETDRGHIPWRQHNAERDINEKLG